MARKDELTTRLHELEDHLHALEHPIPDETDHERQARQAAYHRADREIQEVKADLRSLDYELRQRAGDVGPRESRPNMDPEEEFKRDMKGLDDWANQPEPSRDQDKNKKLARDEDRPLWERPVRDDEERERPDRDERER